MDFPLKSTSFLLFTPTFSSKTPSLVCQVSQIHESTEKEPPNTMTDRNPPRSPSESSPLSDLSTTPSLPDLPETQATPHKQAHTFLIQTAKCDNCNTAGLRVLQRCSSCSNQLCRECISVWKGDGIHQQMEELEWDAEKASKRKASSRGSAEDASFTYSSEDPALFSAKYPSSESARRKYEYMKSQKRKAHFEEDYEEEQEDEHNDDMPPFPRRFAAINRPQPPRKQQSTIHPRDSARFQAPAMASTPVPHTETLAVYQERIRQEKAQRLLQQAEERRANEQIPLPSIENRVPSPRSRIQQSFSGTIANMPPRQQYFGPPHHPRSPQQSPERPPPRPQQPQQPSQPRFGPMNIPSSSMPTQQSVNRVVDAILEHERSKQHPLQQEIEPSIQLARARAEQNPWVQTLRAQGRDREANEVIYRVCLYYKISLSYLVFWCGGFLCLASFLWKGYLFTTVGAALHMFASLECWCFLRDFAALAPMGVALSLLFSFQKRR